jgi:DNA-binding NtrC family response regulator
MQYQALIVSESGEADTLELVQSLPVVRWQHQRWEGFHPESLLELPVGLVILAGVPDPIRTLECLRWLENRSIRSAVLAVLPGDLDEASVALAAAIADDFVLWPERATEIRQRVMRLLPLAAQDAENAYDHLIRELAQVNLIGRDPVFLRMVERASRSANSGFPVLITGETGTGKEIFARAIHFMSRRRSHPFIPVDCGGIPDHLLENELFGHARGAYTDAHGDQRGLAAAAEGGTLFLDEVDSLSPGAQTKLLRFLQERQFKPLGSERYVHSDVKIIAASNRNLRQLVAGKLFREDLYFRLDVLHIELCPLRERPQDIPLLAQHFLAMYLPAGERKLFSPSALRQLSAHAWPGNVRELLNVVQRSIVFAQSSPIHGRDLVFGEPTPAPAGRGFRKARESAIESFERDYVQELLQRNGGNITRAALDAGKERRAFGRLVKKYGLGMKALAAGQGD